MASEETCPERVIPKSGWERPHTCGKPVKSDGLCGVHAAAKHRREASKAAEEAKQANSRFNQEVVRAALAELGIDGEAHYSIYGARYTGRVVVSIETLEELSRRNG